MNQQVKAGLKAVREFLAGRSGEAKPADADDKDTRQVVGAELLAAMSGQNTGEHSSERKHPEPGNGTSESSEPGDGATVRGQEQERARKLFLDHGYFDEAVENLRSAKSPEERAEAARALGLFGSQRGTPHLIAAMFDEDVSVRAVAEEALAQIGDPTVSEDSVDAAVAQETEELREIKLSQAAIHHQVEQPQVEPPVQELAISPPETLPVISTTAEVETEASSTAAASADESQLLQEEANIKSAIEKLSELLAQTESARQAAEAEIQLRIEQEEKLRAEASQRIREEEEIRLRANQEAEARRTQEREAFAVEQSARAQAEVEAQRHSENFAELQLEAVRLRASAADAARNRIALEHAREEAAEAEHRAELAQARADAKSRHEAELTRLQSEQEALQLATNEVATQRGNVIAAREKATLEIKNLREELAAVEATHRAEAERLRREAEERNQQAEEQLRATLEELRRAEEEVVARRAEVEAARAKAEADAERLVAAQARMRSAEETRNQAETERAKLEAEINQQVEAQARLLEETRRRGQEEKQRIEDELRLMAEGEQRRLEELESMRNKAETDSKQRAEKEHQIKSQIDSLRIADAETRKRIADAENRRRSADEAYRLVAEKVQRIEAEAHARAMEEERILAKLEAERRTVALEAQSRAEQEKRIKEEIEMFRRLEEQERPRLEEATLQLAAAEARLEERRERLKADEEARLRAEEALSAIDTEPVAAPSAHTYTSPRDEPEVRSSSYAAPPFATVPVPAHNTATPEELDNDEDISIVAPAITTYLNSVDPYKRAAAVAELARSGSEDAFGLIVNCFDDHSPHVRNAAARAFRKLEPSRTVDLFNRSLEGASAERRRNIGAAIAASGLATEAIDKLDSENREDTYNALSILFVMAKTGEVEPLVQAIERHESVQVRMAAIKLLTLTGQSELANAAAKRRLDKNPPELDHLD